MIALPLSGKSLKYYNSAFLNPTDFEPYRSQYDLLGSFQKLTKVKFRIVYENIFNEKVEDFFKSSFDPNTQPVIEIQINGQVLLRRLHLNRRLIEFIRKNLNFLNSDYLVKKSIGKSTFNLEKYFRLVEETPEGVIIPRGFFANLIAFCKNENMPFKIIDNRKNFILSILNQKSS